MTLKEPVGTEITRRTILQEDSHAVPIPLARPLLLPVLLVVTAMSIAMPPVPARHFYRHHRRARARARPRQRHLRVSSLARGHRECLPARQEARGVGEDAEALRGVAVVGVIRRVVPRTGFTSK